MNECATTVPNCKIVGVKISYRKLCDVIFTDITGNSLFQLSRGKDMLLLVFLCFISLCDLSLSVFTKNVTDLSKCKVYYSRSEMAYRNFFTIRNETHRLNGTVFDFHFSVLAASNAHILLSPSISADKSDPAYEIVIGAGNNLFSDIRRSQKGQVKATNKTPGILSALDPVGFWIHISTEGLIEVGKAGENVSFISWQDPHLLPLRFFSFSTWSGVEAKWYFDCPNEANKTSDSELVMRNLTYTESLREDLLYAYDPYVRPVFHSEAATLVSLSMKTHYVNLDLFAAKLQIKGVIQMTWHDEKLMWDPKNYGEVESVHVRNEEIWKPPLILYNAVGSGDDYLVTGAMAVVIFNGEVRWSPAIDIEAWCDPQGLGSWPNEMHECDLLFGFAAEKYSMQLKFLSNSSTVIGKSYATGWEVVELDLDWYEGDESGVYNKTLFNAPTLYLLFQLKMDARMYNLLFYAPFIVAAVMLLSSFWVCPMGYLKISLNCFQLIITSLTIIVLSRYVPPHPEKIPYFVWLHASLLILGVVCVALNIIIINLSRNEHEQSLPRILVAILTYSGVRWLLLLPETVKGEGNLEYGKLKETEPDKRTTSTAQDTWILLGILIDRISFIWLSCIIIAAVALKY